MPLVVEDGSGLTDSNSYATDAEASVYAQDRGVSEWDAADITTREAALLDATVLLDSTYRWPGVIASSDQALGWPRSNATDLDGRPLSGLPGAVKRATMELAVYLVRKGRTVVTDSEAAVVRSREKVGTLEVETEYAGGGNKATVLKMVGHVLARIVARRSNSGTLVRR